MSRIALLVVAASIGLSTRGLPQEAHFTERAPRFLLASAAKESRVVRVDVARTPVLRRRVTIDYETLTLDEALKRLAQTAGLQLAYSTAVIPSDKVVSLRAQEITVAAALTELLIDADVDILFSTSGQAVVIRRSDAPKEVAPAVGTVAGRVTDAESTLPIAGAQVRVSGTNLGRLTDDSGRYAIVGVPAGEREVRVRRVGYSEASQQVRVEDGGTTVADFSLTRVATRLSEIVTTVTGEQRRIELGNALARVPADSVAANTHVRNIGELISGRAAGVLVSFPTGAPSQAPRIRIRGTNSLTVRNDPIMIVDGVRVDNSSSAFGFYIFPGGALAGFAEAPQNGRLSDLNPDEIENIEIVKGPSAATLYGTDAANGVIVVTTKKGRAGPAEWTLNIDQGITQPRGTFEPNYYAWGRRTDGTPVQCTIVARAASPCTVDSLTSFNPLKNSSTTPFANGQLQKYGVQVSGGVNQFRFYLSGEYTGELGVLQLNEREQAFLRQIRGTTSIPDEQVHPSLAERTNLRGNVAAQLGSNADVSVSTALIRNNSRIANDALVIGSGVFGRGVADTLQQWSFNRRPGYALAQATAEGVTRSITSISANWQPLSWLRTRGTLGLDYGASEYITLAKRGEYPVSPTGVFVQQSNGTSLYSADVGATAQSRLAESLSLRTSIGAQLHRSKSSTTIAAASNLAPGASTAAGAATVTGETRFQETVVAGSYIEEMLGVHERLFLTGAVRLDGASSFGEDFSTALYPKATLSWLALTPTSHPLVGLSAVRLRLAYGASGVQPSPIAGYSRYTLFAGFAGGTSVNAAAPLALGNPDVRPERQREIEVGVDIDVLDGRVRLELTAYNRESSDALINQLLPFSFGLGTSATRQVNVGKVRNRGLEGLLGATVVDNPAVAWDITLNGYANQNRLLRLAPDIPVLGSGFSRNVLGFPINGVWDRPILGYSDANGDGVIAGSEITLGDSAVFLGPVNPTRSFTGSTTIRLLKKTVSFSALIDRREGFVRWDNNNANRCAAFFSSCRAMNDATVSLEEQVAAALRNRSPAVWTGFVHDGSYTSLRELSVTIASPRVSRLFRARGVALTFAGRNLAVWSRYPGMDVESTNALGGSDFFADNPVIPPTRQFIARARLTY